MRDIFVNNTAETIKYLRENKTAWRRQEIAGDVSLTPETVKAFRYNEDAEFIEVIDSHGNFWCVYYAPGIGVFIEDSMPKPDMPGEGWELLSWV